MSTDETTPPTVRTLLEALGLPAAQGSLDEALRWALIKLQLQTKDQP